MSLPGGRVLYLILASWKAPSSRLETLKPIVPPKAGLSFTDLGLTIRNRHCTEPSKRIITDHILGKSSQDPKAPNHKPLILSAKPYASPYLLQKDPSLHCNLSYYKKEAPIYCVYIYTHHGKLFTILFSNPVK